MDISALLKTATKWKKDKCFSATSEQINDDISVQWCTINKQEKKTDTCNRNESQKHHVKLKKPDTKDYILYDFIYTKFLKKENSK